MLRTVIVLMVISIAVPQGHAGEVQGSSFGFGNWSGAAYVSDINGSFSHCAIGATYQGGDTLYFSVNASQTVSVGVYNEAFRLQPGETFPVELFVDRRPPFGGTAEAVDSTFAMLKLSNFHESLRAFQKGYNLTIESPFGLAHYDLTGTFRALEEAKKCVSIYGQGWRTPLAQETYRPQEPAVDQTLLFQIATQTIADLEIKDFTYVRPFEVGFPDLEKSVVWVSDNAGITGAVIAIGSEGLEELKASDGGDIAFLSLLCDGELATTSKEVDIEGFSAREIRGLCLFENSQRTTHLTKMLVGHEVLYTLLSFEETSLLASSEERRVASQNAAIRAASFVKD